MMLFGQLRVRCRVQSCRLIDFLGPLEKLEPFSRGVGAAVGGFLPPMTVHAVVR